MKPTPPPPPPRWFWFAAVAGLALLASLTIAAGRDPPGGAQALSEPTRSSSADERSSATFFDSSPAFDRRCLICQQPLY
jgi:hypothetical protein